MRLGFWLAIALISAFSVGLFVHMKYVRPTEARLLAQEARNLAREIDTVLKVRDAAIGMAVSSLDPGRALSSEALERLVRGFQRTFPDFLSLEIASDKGELLAMIGELTLPQAPRQGSRSSQADQAEASTAANHAPFFDDPSRGSFVICREERSPEGHRWFARARFSRTVIENVLGSAAQGKTFRLVPSTGGGYVSPTGMEQFEGNLLSPLHGPGFAEAPLAAPGWLVRVERPAATGSAGFLAAGMAGSLLLISGCLALPVILRRLSAAGAPVTAVETAPEQTGSAASAGTTPPRPTEERFPAYPAPELTVPLEATAAHPAAQENDDRAAADETAQEPLTTRDGAAGTSLEDYSIEEILGRPDISQNAAAADEPPDVAKAEEPSSFPLADGVEELEISDFIHADFSDLEDEEEVEIAEEFPAAQQRTDASHAAADYLEPPEVLEVEWMEFQDAPDENSGHLERRKYSGA